MDVVAIMDNKLRSVIVETVWECISPGLHDCLSIYMLSSITRTFNNERVIFAFRLNEPIRTTLMGIRE